MIDLNIRVLVSHHIHLKPTWKGRSQYEWAECKDSLSTTDAIKSGYSLDKKTFALYQSASLHTKQQRKIPMAFFVLIFAFMLFSYLSYGIYQRKFSDNQDVLPRGAGQHATGGETALVSSNKNLSSNQSTSVIDVKPVLFTSQELSFKSYEGLTLDSLDRLPKTCQRISSKAYKCLVTARSNGLYKNVYCLNNQCWSIIPLTFSYQEHDATFSDYPSVSF